MVKILTLSFLLIASPAWAAVAFDACTESAEFTTTSPATFNHTPVGTPRGVWVFIGQGDAYSVDAVTAVTYGGTSMTRVNTAVDTAGEPSRAYGYFLGSSVSTGTQTVSITHNGNNSGKIAYACTVTASADTEVKASGIDQESQADPSVTLDCGADTCLRFSGIVSGHALASALTPAGDMTAVDNYEAFSNSIVRLDRETTPSSGSNDMSYTATADDVAMVAAGIGEVAAGGSSRRVAPIFFQ